MPTLKPRLGESKMLSISKEALAKVKQAISGKHPAGFVKAVLRANASPTATEKEVVEFLASIGYTIVAPKSFIVDYYARLRERDLDEQEYKDIIANASNNTQKNVKYYDRLRLHCNAIRKEALASKGK